MSSIQMSGSGIRTGLSSVKVLEFGTEGTVTANAGLAVTGSTSLASASVSSFYNSGASQIRGDLRLENALTMDNVTISSAGAIAGATTIDASGVVTAGGLTVGSAVMNEADLEKLDDITNGTVAASKAVVVDSDKDASGFRNITAAGAITAGTSFIIGSADLNETDLEKLDGITDGTAAANKALVLDGSKDASGLRNLSLTSITDGTATLTGGNLQAVGQLTASYAKIGTLDVTTINSVTTTVENVEVSASLMILSDGAAQSSEADGSGMFISGANAQFVWNNSKAALSSSHKMFVGGNMELDSGASFVIGSADMDETDLEKLDGITNGTVAANKAVVVDASKDLAGVNDLTLEGSLIIGDASMSETDLEKLDGITNGAGAANKALVLDASADVASGLRSVTGSGDAYFAKLRSSGEVRADGAGVFGGNLDTSGDLTAATITMTGFSVDADGDVVSSRSITAGSSFIIGSADLNETDLEKLDGITDGTAAANKAMVLDSNADISGGRNLTISGELDAASGDFSGNIDVDGTANLDDVDIDGNTQADGTLTVGVNGTGYDVKFYGDTAGSYLMWDESSNSLNMINSHMSGASATFHGAVYSMDDASNNISILVPETHSIKAGQFVTFSDATLKKNVKQLDGAIEKVMSMRGVSYEMKKDNRGRAEVGFIAQEMKQVVPEVVYGDKDGNHGIDYGKLTSILVEAVKAQQTQIDELKALLKK